MSRALRVAVQAAVPGAPSKWDMLTLAFAGVMLQYVWRLQSIFPQLALVQFTTIVSLGAVAFFVIDRDPTRRLSHINSGILYPMFVICAFGALSIPTSLRDGDSFRYFTSTFLKTVVLAAVLAATIRDRHDVERLLRVLVLGALGYIVMSFIVGIGVQARLAGIVMYDPNDMAVMALSTIPFCIYFVRRGAAKLDRVAGAITTILLLVAVVQSGSRGGFLALCALVVYGIVALGSRGLIKRLMVIGTAVTMLVAFGGDAYESRLRTILNPEHDYNVTAESGRIGVWKRGLGYMMSNPLLGVGIGQYDVAEGLSPASVANQRAGIGFKWSAAHNSFVQIGAELGVFGLTAFCALMWVVFKYGRRVAKTASAKDDRALGLAFSGFIVGFAVGCFFLSHAYATYPYLVAGLLCGLARVVQRDVQLPAAVPSAARQPLATSGLRPRVRAAMRGGLGLR